MANRVCVIKYVLALMLCFYALRRGCLRPFQVSTGRVIGTVLKARHVTGIREKWSSPTGNVIS